MSQKEKDKKENFLSLCRGFSMEIVKTLVTRFKKSGVDQEIIDTVTDESWPKIEKVLESSVDAFLEAAGREKEKLEREKSRKDYLGRIIIEQIKDMFPPEDDYDLTGKICLEFVEGVLPRQLVPGLLGAIGDMFGQEYIEEKVQETKVIVLSHSAEDSETVEWKKVHTDPKTKKLIYSLLSKVKTKLEQPDEGKVKEWFIKRITSTATFKVEIERNFEERDYRLLTDSLFRILQKEK